MCRAPRQPGRQRTDALWRRLQTTGSRLRSARDTHRTRKGTLSTRKARKEGLGRTPRFTQKVGADSGQSAVATFTGSSSETPKRSHIAAMPRFGRQEAKEPRPATSLPLAWRSGSGAELDGTRGGRDSTAIAGPVEGFTCGRGAGFPRLRVAGAGGPTFELETVAWRSAERVRERVGRAARNDEPSAAWASLPGPCASMSASDAACPEMARADAALYQSPPSSVDTGGPPAFLTDRMRWARPCKNSPTAAGRPSCCTVRGT